MFEALINGDRQASRQIVQESINQGACHEAIVMNLFWPVYERVQKLHRKDQISTVAHHLATRLLRSLADQAAANYRCKSPRNRSIFAVSGPSDSDELGGQIAVDLLEGDGYEVAFAGGGIANDEILSRIHQVQPDVLLLFASAPSDLPSIRALVDKLNEIGACRNTQIVVGGGVFNRAEGLAEEIGADLWATSPDELLEVMRDSADRRATSDQRTVGRQKRRKVA